MVQHIFSRSEVQNFFIACDLIPGEYESITDNLIYLSIIFKARAKGEAFGRFVRESLTPITHGEYALDFSSWEELFECYYCYMAGFSKTKTNQVANA